MNLEEIFLLIMLNIGQTLGEKREFTCSHSESLSNKKFENSLEIFAATKTRNHCAVKCVSMNLGVTSFVYNAGMLTCRCYDDTIDTSIYKVEPGSYFYNKTMTSTFVDPSKTPCKSLHDAGQIAHGVYTVEMSGFTFDVYCNMTDGGWTYLQHRMDGTVDFEFKTYSEYETGFGQAAGEHWIGLRYMHIMTSQPRIVQVDEVDVNGVWYFLKYSDFLVRDSTSNYTLKVGSFLDGYSSSSGLLYNSGNQFYARDQDNEDGCAILRRCGFWFDFCTMSNINGVYGKLDGASGMRDDTGGSIKYLSYTALKIQ